MKAWTRTVMDPLDLPFPPRFERLSQVVDYMLAVGKTRPINICIDECQGINVCEPSF
ncbi:hypothetical protein [Sutterella seckii]|uniref:hypothetical protein n=1 Tax=Sutterella seckii TaxID=1944635 RepID=UPI00186A54AB|nr:hypothetical protein [Sutterella seckii]MBS5218293.1 hypothetical protein [Sutterella wadsworthensis]